MLAREFFEELQKNPAKVLESVRSGETNPTLRYEGIPLISLALGADNVELAAELIKQGADVNEYAVRPAAERGMAPIHFAKTPAAVAALVAGNVNIDAPYKDVDHAWGMRGETALHSAALGDSRKDMALATALIAAGANQGIPYNAKEFAYGRDSNLALGDRVVREGTSIPSRLQAMSIALGEEKLVAVSAVSRDQERPDLSADIDAFTKAGGKAVSGRVVAFGFEKEDLGNGFNVEIQAADGTKEHARTETIKVINEFISERFEIGDTVHLQVDADGQIYAFERDQTKVLLRDEAVEEENTFRPVQPPRVEEEKNEIRQASPAAGQADDEIRQAGGAANKTKAGGELDPAGEKQRRDGSPATLLKGRFIRDDIGVYRRLGETREALADEGGKIRFIDKQMDAFEAGVELAKAKGWSAIEVAGSEKFRSEAWFHAKSAGLDVIGYEPNPQDIKRLAAGDLAVKGGEKAAQKVDPILQASADAASEFALKAGLGVKDTNTKDGRYSGKVLHSTEQHLVADNGRGTAVIHRKADLDPAYQDFVNSPASLKVYYQQGRGVVAPLADKSKSHTR